MNEDFDTIKNDYRTLVKNLSKPQTKVIEQEREELIALANQFDELLERVDAAGDGEDILNAVMAVEEVKEQYVKNFLILAGKVQNKSELKEEYTVYMNIHNRFEELKASYPTIFNPGEAYVNEERKQEEEEKLRGYKALKNRENWMMWFKNLLPTARRELYRKIEENKKQRLGSEQYMARNREKAKQWYSEKHKEKKRQRERELKREKALQKRFEQLKRMLG